MRLYFLKCITTHLDHIMRQGTAYSGCKPYKSYNNNGIAVSSRPGSVFSHISRQAVPFIHLVKCDVYHCLLHKHLPSIIWSLSFIVFEWLVCSHLSFWPSVNQTLCLLPIDMMFIKYGLLSYIYSTSTPSWKCVYPFYLHMEVSKLYISPLSPLFLTTYSQGVAHFKLPVASQSISVLVIHLSLHIL